MKEGFFIRYIGNKKGEIGLQIVDIDKNIILDETEISIKRVMTEEDVKQIVSLEEEIKELNKKIFNIKKCNEVFANNIKTEIAEKVKEKKYTFATGNTIENKVYKTYQEDKEWQQYMYETYEEVDFIVAKEIFDSLSEEEIFELAKEVEKDIQTQFEKIEKIKEINSLKVLKAFQK